MTLSRFQIMFQIMCACKVLGCFCLAAAVNSHTDVPSALINLVPHDFFELHWSIFHTIVYQRKQDASLISRKGQYICHITVT
jgi:hypothetical protein